MTVRSGYGVASYLPLQATRNTSDVTRENCLRSLAGEPFLFRVGTSASRQSRELQDFRGREQQSGYPGGIVMMVKVPVAQPRPI